MSEPNVQSEREAFETINAAFNEYLQRTHLVNQRQQHRLGALGYAEEEWVGFEAGYRAALASRTPIPAQAGEREAFDAWEAALKISEIDESIGWTAWQARAALASRAAAPVRRVTERDVPCSSQGCSWSRAHGCSICGVDYLPRAAAQAPAESGVAEIEKLIDDWMGRYGSTMLNPGETMARLDIKSRIRALAGQASTQAPALTPEVVEERLHAWRQRIMNEDGDRLALTDYMGVNAIDDLIDFVCGGA